MELLKTTHPLQIGVLGATGYIGAPYRKEIRACPQAQIVALCARRRDLLEAAGAEDGATCLTDDWREVINHPEVNLVVVATPDALHHEAVMACAQADRHVLCEKPVGLNSREAREMLEAYRARPHLAHYVPFWVRYTDAMRRARDVVQEGTLGEIRGVVYRWHNPRPPGMPYTWRDDPNLSAAGSIADVGSHAYDTIRWMLGNDAVRVLCHATTLSSRTDAGAVNLTEALQLGTASDPRIPNKAGGTVDYATISWEFADDAVGTLILSHAPYYRKGLAPELELHGTEGSLTVERLKGEIILAKQGSEPEVIATLPDRPETNRFLNFVFPAMEDVIAGRPPNPDHPTLEDGWQVQRFTDAAAASAKRGAWVALNETAPN